MLVPFRSFAFLRMFCLSLNRKSLQTIVPGLLLLFLPALCARSISTGLWMQELNTGLWTLDTRLWTMDSVSWFLDTTPWTMDSRRWNLDVGPWNLDSGCWTLDSGRQTLEAGLWTLWCQTLDAGLWTLDTFVDCFRIKSESSFWFCLIKLWKNLWVQNAKDFIVTVVL